MAKHHPDLIFCRKQPGVGKYYSSNIKTKRWYSVRQPTSVSLYRSSHWTPVRKVRWKVRDLRLVRATVHVGSYL